MAYQNDLLFRTFPDDTGKEHYKLTYSSPDIISHEQVPDPSRFFTGNYQTDPNQPANKQLKTNLIYTRVKNYRNLNEPIVGYIRLYKSCTSLYLNPESWSKNRLSTPRGKSYVRVETLPGEKIGVAEDLFVIDGTSNPSFCLLGIVNTDTSETIPEVGGYTDYLEWIHSNPAVCARNLSVVSAGSKEDSAELYYYCNPEDHDVPVTFVFSGFNLPDKTLIGITCEALKLSREKSVDSSECNIELKVTVPAGYKGYLKAYASLPAGAVWPANARTSIGSHLDAKPSDRIFRFGVSPSLVLNSRKLLSSYNSENRLVLLGECGVVFK